jgi:hypothetical protein
MRALQSLVSGTILTAMLHQYPGYGRNIRGDRSATGAALQGATIDHARVLPEDKRDKNGSK